MLNSDRDGSGPRPGFFLYSEYRARHFFDFLGFSWTTGPGAAQVNKSNPEPRNRPRLTNVNV